MRTITIGQLKIVVHPDHRPSGWNKSDDFWRRRTQLNASVHRLESWTGRFAYVIEHDDTTIMLTAEQAERMAACILNSANSSKAEPVHGFDDTPTAKPNPAPLIMKSIRYFLAAILAIAFGQMVSQHFAGQPLVQNCFIGGGAISALLLGYRVLTLIRSTQ